MEALVPMVNEGWKRIYPNGFISLAEEIGLVDAIDQMVFKDVCL